MNSLIEQTKTFATLDVIQVMGATVFEILKQKMPIDEVIITISTPERSSEWFFARTPPDTTPHVGGTSVHHHIHKEDVTVCVTTNSSIRDTTIFLFTFMHGIDLISYETLLHELRKCGFVE